MIDYHGTHRCFQSLFIYINECDLLCLDCLEPASVGGDLAGELEGLLVFGPLLNETVIQ